jgi:hypothetical protein
MSRPRKRRFEQTEIAHAGIVAVLGKLLVMNRENHSEFDPNGFLHGQENGLLGQLTQRRSSLPHDFPGGAHLRFKCRVIGPEPIAIGRFRDVQRVPPPVRPESARVT